MTSSPGLPQRTPGCPAASRTTVVTSVFSTIRPARAAGWATTWASSSVLIGPTSTCASCNAANPTYGEPPSDATAAFASDGECGTSASAVACHRRSHSATFPHIGQRHRQARQLLAPPPPPRSSTSSAPDEPAPGTSENPPAPAVPADQRRTESTLRSRRPDTDTGQPAGTRTGMSITVRHESGGTMMIGSALRRIAAVVTAVPAQAQEISSLSVWPATMWRTQEPVLATGPGRKSISA